MIQRPIVLAHASFLLLSVLFGLFAAAKMIDTTPDDRGVLLFVQNSGRSVDTDDVFSPILEFAREHRVNVVFESADLRSPTEVRHLYVAVGDQRGPGGDWVEEGYGSLPGGPRTEVHELSAAAEVNPFGGYHFYGPEETATEFVETMTGLGFSSYLADEYQILDRFEAFRGSMLFNLFAMTLVCGATSIAAGVLLGSRGYAVKRLQGLSYTGVLLRDIVLLARFWVPIAVITAAGTIGSLFLSGGLDHLRLVADMAFVYLAIFVLVGLFVHAITLAAVYRTGILAGLKGRLPQGSTIASAYTVRALILLSVVGIGANLVLSFQELQERREAFSFFGEVGDTSRIHLNQHVDRPEMTAELGSWLRGLDASGQLVIAAPGRADNLFAGASGDFGALVVNDAYLERHPVSADGGTLGPTGSGQVRVLIPQSREGEEQQIRGVVEGWVRGKTEQPVSIVVGHTKAGEALFTYGAAQLGLAFDLPFMRDPVVIALPNGSPVFTDEDYRAYAEAGAAVFPDRERLLAAVTQPGLSDLVSEVLPVKTDAAVEYAEAADRVRLQALTCTAGIAVTAIAGIAAAIVLVRSRSRHIFVQYLNGWSFISMYRSVLAVEVAFVVVFTGRAFWEARRTLADSAAPGGEHALAEGVVRFAELGPVLAVAVTGIGFLVVMAALGLLHRRIVRTGPATA